MFVISRIVFDLFSRNKPSIVIHKAGQVEEIPFLIRSIVDGNITSNSIFPVNTFEPLLSPVPKDRDKCYFKLRQGVQKKVVVTVQQMSNQELGIER